MEGAPMDWFNKMIVGMMPVFPKNFIWIFSRPYIAGKRLEDAVRKTKELNAAGILATIDVLGEDIKDLSEATAAKEEGLAVLDAIRENGLDANLSVKLTQLGLHLDREACFQNVHELAKKAAENNNFLRIDMEDSTCTDDTLGIYRRIRKEFPRSGAVVQAYMKRSEADVRALIGERIAHLRICKGIYDESSEIAYKDREEIREAYKKLVLMMFDSGSFAAIATHDKKLAKWAVQTIRERNIPRENYEFQMLLGVTEKLRRDLVSDGHPLRVYVPFGEQWYRYCMRRMKENPSVAGYVVMALFIRG
jgi:proline dehydrogenase